MTDSFFAELKRRNVLRVLVAYIALGWLVIQIADILTPAFNLPEWTLRFLIIVGALGLPFVLFFSWAFEITPEGVKREEEVDRSQSITNVTAQKLNTVIVVLLVILIGHSVYRSQHTPEVSEQVTAQTASENQTANQPKENTTEATSIAVLPFENMSSDPEQEYFSDGISEELLNLLAKIPDLKVAARTSSFRFKDTNESIQEIAKKLGVANVLEGSIRKSGNKIRITAQLIHAEDGFHLWSETYDEELTDIFTIQDKISAAIVDSLRESLGIELKKVTTQITEIDPVAHDYYLRAQELIKTGSFDSLRQAEDYLQLAMNLEPEFLPARTELVNAIVSRYTIGDIEGTTQLTLAESLLQYVLEREPSNATATYYLAAIYNLQRRWDEAIAVFERALKLEPNHPFIFRTLGNFGFGGRFNHLIEKDNLQKSFDYLVSRDPYNGALYFDWGRVNRWVFLDYDTAEKMFRRAAEIQPDNANPVFGMALLFAFEKGDLASAIAPLIQTHEMDKSDPDGSIYLSLVYTALGELDTAIAWADEAISILPESGEAQLAKVKTMFANGDLKAGYELIEKTLSNKQVFHRRSSQRVLMRLGVFYLLTNNQADEAKEFMLKH
ncbi:MAG: tetratricopeptide repeat protein, partial [Enterobacterales bacterium]|nr:tetratricopeptide repeat protein [Enterobacterales bacterium]